jgi:hypothetical protein
MTASEKWDDYLKVGDRRDVDMGTALSIVADLAAKERESSDLSLRLEQMRGAVEWALGERGEFVDRQYGQGAFWWRTELRKRSALSTPPGELVQEVRVVLSECVNLLEFIEPEVRGGYSPDGALAGAKSLLARLGGEA